FSVGYKCTYETVGTDVTVTFEMLDDKAGVIAYLWKETPFAESAMTNVSGKIFSTTLAGQTPGATISYACKFAFNGGMSVTKYMTYVVGTNCGSTTNDTQAPTGFTATLGAITGSSVELLLNATDNSGTVVYNVTYGTSTASTSTASGTQKSLLITALNPATNYSFSITASDLAGNKAANNPIVVSATTTANTNTDCAGTASEASQGAFSVGYKYGFTTTGSDVKVDFELLDDKAGVVAYVWNYTTGFAEVSMTNVGGKKFSKTLTGQTAGTVIKIACKFAYAGGMVVTKQFSYTVGNACEGTAVQQVISTEPFFYPNPIQNVLHLKFDNEDNRFMLFDIVGNKVIDQRISSDYTFNTTDLKSGIYFLKVENTRGIYTGKVIKK
ncbi:MAG: T9SS type A sorting domain-containing protein, partial [Paludibacter sp.]